MTTAKQESVATPKDSVWHHLTPSAAQKSGLPTFVKGEGMYVWDDSGTKYLDASAGGVWVANVGYGRKDIVDAMSAQLMKLHFFAGSMPSVPAIEFADKLLEKMPNLSRVYYSNSGSEANEKAFKMVRQISHKHYDGKKYKILYRDRDYHGTTIGALSATGQSERRQQYGPFVPGFIEFPHCYEYRSHFTEETRDTTLTYGVQAAREMEKVILREGADTVGAVILEPITAGGGIIMPEKDYWTEIQRICKKYNVLLILDEVVCGMGRTGKWFGYQHYNIQPDIVTMAKGLASGYAAISCTVTTEAVYDALQDTDGDPMGYFRDISTYGGCQSGPAAALANLKIIENENLLENCHTQGQRLLDGLHKLKEKYTIIGDIRGCGLFAGIEFVANRETKEPVPESVVIRFVGRCKQLGLLIGRTNRSFAGMNNIANLSPALIATADEIDNILRILDTAFAEL